MLKDKADNTYQELDYSRYHNCTGENSNRTELLETLILLLEIMRCAHKLQILDIYLLADKPRSLLVVLIFKINCRLLANEKTDSEHNA